MLFSIVVLTIPSHQIAMPIQMTEKEFGAVSTTNLGKQLAKTYAQVGDMTLGKLQPVACLVVVDTTLGKLLAAMFAQAASMTLGKLLVAK
jgi:hypothetical protein